MSSSQSFVEYICEQAAPSVVLTYRKMFGEYALYVGEKVVALVCDNDLFLKITNEGRVILANPEEKPPYSGAKAHFRITSLVDDRTLLPQLFQTTADNLKAAKPKRKK